jgi:signal transduction histidine kinase
LQPVQAADVVEAALKAAAPSLRQAAMQVEKSVPPDLPLVLADANALNQCLENLIANAVKYAHSGGWLGVRASVSGAEPQREVEIVVEDRGPGIAHADLSHIFEPFYRAKHARESQVKGAGLGLYLVRRMMEGMGGRVSSWSRPGRGARFTLHLPVAGAESPEQSQPGG